MILVVDDDKNIRLSLWFILKQGESQTPKAVSE
jgi:FixJ family two-component response regulator